MKIIFTSILLFFLLEANSQIVTNYTSTVSTSGTFTALTSATNPTITGSPTSGYFNGIPIGFDFWYMGTRYTTISASVNGWLTFGSNITNSTPTNNLTSGGAPRPVIAPLWDDLDLQAATNFSYKTTGSVGSRIFTAQYLNVKWNASATGNTVSFQVILFEATGMIEFLYRQETGALFNPSASIGITATATGSGNFLSFASNGTVSSTTETNNINIKPPTGTYVDFTPAVPTAPTNLSFTSVSGTGMTLNWTDNASNEVGYVIYRSTDGINYSFVTQAAANVTQSIQTGLTSGATYYWKVYAVTEGALSSALSGNMVACGNSISQIPSTNLITNYKFDGSANDNSTANNDGILQNAPTLSADRFTNANSAYTFNGTSQYIATTNSYSNPTNFSVSVWFKTTTTSGGKLIGFGSSQTGSSSSDDRHLYMNNAGQIYFGVYPNAVKTINSSVSYNDGNWHLATATLSSTAGMVLYMDGVQVAADASTTSAQSYTGYWRVGYDNTSGWNSTPSSYYFNGTLDDILIYQRAITSSEVATLYNSPDGAGNNGPLCWGSTLNLTATTVSGATYIWTGPNSFTSSSQNPSLTYSAAAAGKYTVQVTSGGCTATAYTMVTSAATSSTISYAGSPFCGGTGTVSVTRTGASGGTYSSTAGLSINSSTGAINLTSSTAGTYTITYTVSGGCSSTTIVGISSLPTASGATTVTCVGGSTGTITITGSGGTTPYTYSIDGTTYQSSATFTALAAGSYTIYVKAISGCIGTSTVTVSQYANSTDDQNASATDSWIGHVYDGTNFTDYIGHYTEAETFDESFGGSTTCFNVVSNSVTRSIYTESFSVKYRMSSTKKGLYIADLGSDDGGRLTVDGTMVYNNWTDQAFSSKPRVLMNLTGASSLLYEFYESGGGNEVAFQNFTQVLSNTLSTNTTQTICIGNPGLSVSGDTYGTLPTGITLSGTGYQWSYSTTPGGARTNITGATSATFTPSTAVAPFNAAGTYYLYRNAILSSANNVSPTTYVATNESNAATITILPALGAQGGITGSSFVCPGTTGLVYSISAVTNAITYTWTVPSGWTITAGAGTASITVTAGPAGNITVVTSNSCGTNTASILTVTTSQIQVSSTAGTANACYTTVKLAFDAINAGTHQGVITVRVNGSTTETAAAVLNASGTGSAVYTSVNIYPTATGYSITGSLNTPLIDLNGASNVTIDGRVNATGSSKDLVINNTNTGTSSSTIRFINNTSGNTVKYTTIKGASLATAGGVIFFSTTAAGTGNVNNTIDNCNLTGSDNTNRPLNIIYSVGTSTRENTGDVISNNNIYDFLRPGATSYGLDLLTFTSDWTISGNSFYETTAFAPTGVFTYRPIYIANATGNNFIVTNNYIGGSAAQCGGASDWTMSAAFAYIYYGIEMSVGTTTASSIQNNTIKNFDITSTSTLPWAAIRVTGGNVNIGTTTGNTIGAATGTASVTITNTTAAATTYGIYVSSTGTTDISNNNIGSITVVGGAAISHSFNAIFKTGAGTTNIANNIIGSTSTASSIQASTAATAGAQSIYGINSAGTGSVTISGNTIANIYNAYLPASGTTGQVVGINTSGVGIYTVQNNIVHDLSTSSPNTSVTNAAAVVGIAETTTGVGKTISGNTIYNLSGTAASAAVSVIGLYYSGATTGNNTVSGNFIHSLSIASSDITSSIYGIKIAAGTTTYSNNIINLGATVTTGYSIYGIYETGAASNNTNLYFNTVYIGGITTGTTSSTYGLFNNATINVKNIRNNILDNARSGGTTGKHYAIRLAGSTNITIDYNDYFAPNGVIGFNVSDVTILPIVAGQDGSSFNINPGFANAGGTTAANYLPSASSFAGISGTGILTDFNGTTRSLSTPSIGAFEYFISGIISVTSTLGSATTGSYLTLKRVFDAINAGTHQGVITVRVNGSTTETAAAVLNASGTGSAVYTSVNIYPTATGYSITGSLNTPLIDLNGASNVTIDGRVNATGSSKDLVINNTNTGTSSSTIRFINSAENNTIKYCTIKGASLATAGGVIFFSTTAAGTGNVNNTIDNCNLTGSDNTNRPLNIIYSVGTSTRENTGDVISNNNIYDFLRPGATSYGLDLLTFTSDWTISGNSFYETTAFAPTGVFTYRPIYIANASGNNFIVTNNYIGGSAAQCGGASDWTMSAAFAYIYYGIEMSVGTTTASSIQNNTIKNFDITSTSTLPWAAIRVTGGNVNIGTTTANTIGAATGTASVTITNTTAAATTYGIYVSSTGTMDVSNNNIGSITVVGGAAISHSFNAIFKTGAGTTNIANNIIGSTSTASSIQASTAATAGAQSIYGINSAGTGSVTISGNTIANIYNAYLPASGTTGQVVGINTSGVGIYTVQNNIVHDLSTSSPNTSVTNAAAVVGIAETTTSVGKTISGNTIYNLSGTAASAAVSVIGLYYSGATTGINSVSNNFIHSLSLNSSAVAAGIYGIKIAAGTTTYSNNIINLGATVTTGYAIYGIYETGAASNNTNLYFNTVYIGGTTTSSVSLTYALYNNANTNTRDFRNNIFYNARSTASATNTHFAIRLAGTTALTIDNNDYFANGTGGTICRLVSTNYATISAWQTALTAISGDANSLNTDPLFGVAGGTAPANYSPAQILAGIDGTGITTDYFGIITRYSPPKMGAIDCGFNPTLLSTTPTSRCGTGTATLTATVSSGAIVNWYDAATGGNLVGTGTSFTTPSISVTTTYYADATYPSCRSSLRTAVTVTITPSGRWTGAVSNNWNTAGNWLCGGVPTSTVDVLIPTGLSTYPVISSGTGSANSITLQTGATLTVTTTLQIAGSISNSGTITATAGTIEMNGTGAQTIPANAFATNTVSNLTINNTAGVTLAGTLNLTNTLTVSSGAITTGGFLTLKSTATGTARIAQITSVASTPVNGNVTVERYIPGRRKYRIITSSVTTSASATLSAGQESLSIWGNWQNQGNNSTANVGNLITGGTIADGFDQNTTNASVFTYNGTTRKFIGYTSASGKNTKLTPLKAGVPYYMFVYGDRLNTVYTNTPTYTVINATGTVLTGNQVYNTSSTLPLSNVTGEYAMLGNPYASPIDWATLTRTNLSNTYWGWDPNLSSTGGFITVSTTGSVTLISPYSGTTGLNQYIQPGQGFFVRTTAASPSLTIKESDKVSNFNPNAFRTTTNSIPLIAVNLLYNDAGTNILADGAVAAFDSSFSHEVGKEDAVKILNASETVCIENGTDLLSIDARKLPAQNDTLLLNIAKLTKSQYTLQIFASKMENGNVQAYLEDKYLKTVQPLLMSDTNLITFNITSDAASIDVNRFRILFAQGLIAPPLNVTIAATAKDKQVTVDWSVTYETNIKKYDVEHSSDGNTFIKISTTTANGGSGKQSYSAIDASPFAGNNYYRIKVYKEDGTTTFSKVVVVNFEAPKGEVKIFPNPIINQAISMYLNEVPKGDYNLVLYNMQGQQVFSKAVTHSGGSANKTILLDKKITAGAYYLQLKSDYAVYKQMVIVNQ